MQAQLGAKDLRGAQWVQGSCAWSARGQCNQVTFPVDTLGAVGTEQCKGPGCQWGQSLRELAHGQVAQVSAVLSLFLGSLSLASCAH